eukprot:1195766-Prorocentrum_minimum.AAC.3
MTAGRRPTADYERGRPRPAPPGRARAAFGVRRGARGQKVAEVAESNGARLLRRRQRPPCGIDPPRLVGELRPRPAVGPLPPSPAEELRRRRRTARLLGVGRRARRVVPLPRRPPAVLSVNAARAGAAERSSHPKELHPSRKHARATEAKGRARSHPFELNFELASGVVQLSARRSQRDHPALPRRAPRAHLLLLRRLRGGVRTTSAAPVINARRAPNGYGRRNRVGGTDIRPGGTEPATGRTSPFFTAVLPVRAAYLRIAGRLALPHQLHQLRPQLAELLVVGVVHVGLPDAREGSAVIMGGGVHRDRRGVPSPTSPPMASGAIATGTIVHLFATRPPGGEVNRPRAGAEEGARSSGSRPHLMGSFISSARLSLPSTPPPSRCAPTTDGEVATCSAATNRARTTCCARHFG